MVRHDVSRYQATKAYDAVHTEEHQHVERQRRELVERITGAGLSQEKLVEELSKRLANRVVIAPGPKGADVGRPQVEQILAWGGGRLSGTGASNAATLTTLISGWRPSPKSIPPTKPKTEEPKEKEKPPAKPEEPILVRPADIEEPGETLPAPVEIPPKAKKPPELPPEIKPEGLASFAGNKNIGGEQLPKRKKKPTP